MKSFMTENTIKNIDFDYIFNDVKPVTEYGIKVKHGAKPFLKGQEADLREEFKRIRAFTEIPQRRSLLDLLRHVKNIEETIDRAKNNQVLDEVELFEVKNFLILVERMDKILRGISYEGLKLPQLKPLPQLYEKLDPANEKLNTFYIYDQYSENLKEIRREKRLAERDIKSLKKAIKDQVQNKHKIKLNLQDQVQVSKLQKDKIDQLNAEDNLRVCGENYLNIIYALKNTQEIDSLQEKYESLKLAEDKAEEEIRQEISSQVKKHSEILQENTQVMGQIDYIIAKSNHAQKTRSVEPEITTDLEITIQGGRNLKLEKTLKDKKLEYVPIDLKSTRNLLCITGANMGGKTVTLRMIGQIAAMASLGMFVPCEYAKLCLFENIYISVGDDQSIEKGLSTFGAEIVNLKGALENTSKRCLILIDELAGGTNPKEGYAITKAVVNYLKTKDSITVLTTHYDNIANDPHVQNLQVRGLKLPQDQVLIKDIQQIQKYMDYRLIEVKYTSDIPKDALKIARLAGIDEEIIKDAERYL